MPWTKKDWIIMLIVAILASPIGALVYYIVRTKEDEGKDEDLKKGQE